MRNLATGAVCLALCAVAGAQPLPRPPLYGQPGDQYGQPGDLSPAEIQRLFDAYAIVQAQDMLQLNDTQYGQFVTRLKELQDLRRQHQREREELMQGLARLAAQNPPADEAILSERLKSLVDHDTRTATSLKKAYETIDQVLDIAQRARFRVFEDQMERRKLQLLLRARQVQRPNQPERPQPPAPPQ